MPAHSRDYYRHQRQRARQRPAIRVMILRGWWSRDRAEKFADSMPTCSCPMCGNRRRHFGRPTLQERRLRDREKDEEAETLCAPSE